MSKKFLQACMFGALCGFLGVIGLQAEEAKAEEQPKAEEVKAEVKKSEGEAKPAEATAEGEAKAEEAKMTSVTYKVTGMVCDKGCPAAITAAYTKVAGVKEATVNYAEKTVTVKYCPATASDESLSKALEGSKFSAAK